MPEQKHSFTGCVFCSSRNIENNRKEDIYMAKKIAKFEKLSFEQFREEYRDAIGQDSDEVIHSI